MSPDRSQRFETFVTWYLRLNGYFTAPGFVVHAGDDPNRISGGLVGSYTEVDTLAVRLPHSREESGTAFPIDERLVDGARGRFDIVFAEVKSGKSNSPNKTWRPGGRVSNIEYMLKFLGWHPDDARIREVATHLQNSYVFEDDDLRLRYIIFSGKADRTWSGKGVKYITFDDCIRFISEERGQCWAKSGIGRRSMHDRWNDLIKRIFKIANDAELDAPNRKRTIWKALYQG